jgi:hypothetical protein
MRKPGHHPNISNVLLDIYRLLTIFMASRPIAELDDLAPHRGADALQEFGEFEHDEVTRILLTVAITVRVIDDREDKIMDMLADYCGLLTPDIKAPLQTDGLNIRDACNKIVHAKTIEFDWVALPNGRQYLERSIFLSGADHKKRNWRANLNVVKFARECAKILKLLMR